ncbi:fructokinase ScrK [Lentilactobacillus buchneri]|uniref:fructokinase ScrK n=1 Tax=Lentilactobacillus buchneri TaxID=1581 RepID=UPI0010AB9056|nr:fructokinase ScrK [Lentilactobacillus buchneri]TJX98059.1 ROK family protein [Lentilactobacillus buchneri]TJY04396.1 ROK family protein [Lentilactobacillus buchneri]TJY09098.1 ROK family protein [Lentilactobacillus buchneri]TJY14955.1 ROK family protein [Lentilactobacillus buchneri]TJY19401.1 ROK family protein [Lentilactobacillus buchneri]
MLLGSIEAGGTKFICAIGNENCEIVDHISIPTTSFSETMAKVVQYFKRFEGMVALSIASFGPIDLDPTSPRFGYILNTPKQGWAQQDFVGYLKREFSFPIYFTTDVNGSEYGEFTASKGTKHPLDSLIYYTIGTGIGAGIMYHGQLLNGVSHPEAGHVMLNKHPLDSEFKGVCPFHDNCLEGLASGPSIEARLGMRGENVPDDHPVWQVITYYIAQALLQSTLLLRPEQIVLGGGVINPDRLVMVKQQFNQLLNNYVDVGDLDDYIVMPRVENNGSATLGNFALAKHLLA